MRISDWSSDVCSSDLGRENLVLIAKLRHVDRPGTVADDLLDRFSLTDAGRRRVGPHSGGMRRRLDIAMSLLGSPPVVFLDQPRTEERRVGDACVRTWSSRWSPCTEKINKTKHN